MQLDPSRTIDRRSPLEKATRKELEMFAKARGVKEVVCGMPAQLMRQILEVRGHTDIHNFLPRIHGRQLGAMNGVNSRRGEAPGSQAAVRTEKAVDVLMRDWLAQQGAQGAPVVEQSDTLLDNRDGGSIPPASTNKTPEQMKMHELRAYAKSKGVKFDQKTKKAEILARLADGQNTTELRK